MLQSILYRYTINFGMYRLKSVIVLHGGETPLKVALVVMIQLPMTIFLDQGSSCAEVDAVVQWVQ